MICPRIDQNEGMVDRVIRIMLGLISLYLSYCCLAGCLQILVFVVGTLLLITGVSGYCGFYSLLDISTLRRKKKK